MELILTADNYATALAAYHGFHDAQIDSLHFKPNDDYSGYFNCGIILVCDNHNSKSTEKVILSLGNITEFRLAYNKTQDYPNIRDEISIGTFIDLFYIDFGSACEPRTSPEEYRSADSYFICERATLSVVGR